MAASAPAAPSPAPEMMNAGLPLQSHAAILIDARSGDVLYEKNSTEKMEPASITKIVTGIIALEADRSDEQVTVSRNARQSDGTRIFLAEGEQKPLQDLVYGLLMNSGNDAAVAIAEHIDGSVEAFSERMNKFVASIGAHDTHFTNPSGLHGNGHMTTAADMAKIAAYAMKNAKFREIVSTKEKPWEGKEWKSKLVNHNKMLVSYRGANGIKNGFTQQSGFTLVTSAERDGTELIAVLLKADSSRQIYKDATQLLDYGFSHYKTVPVLKAGAKISESGATYDVGENVYASIPKEDAFTIRVGEKDNLLVETTSGLTRQYPAVLSKEQQVTAGAPLAVSDDAGERKPLHHLPEFLMMFFWWLMILFMSWMLVLLLKEKRT
ncbi:D-alanyl-D-alanine carboxypeptidase [Aneurinibacillus sp. BA2021]|nr:D-alanyl-D-alanine carboxypeptidase [Aneurinibacillus sp. BA2021]